MYINKDYLSYALRDIMHVNEEDTVKNFIHMYRYIFALH